MTQLLDCGHPESNHSEMTTGYGTDSQGRKHCYDCCAKTERQHMRDNKKTVLYLVRRDDGWHVTDWPGHLDIKVNYHKAGRNNMARTRHDVWFTFECQEWHGVQYGEWTQLCHCKRVKG